MIRQGFPVHIGGFHQRGMPRDQPTRPHRVTASNGEQGVLDLDCQETTELSEVVNRPPGRRGVVAVVTGIDVGAVVVQQRDDLAMAEERGVMQRRRSVGVVSANERGVHRELVAYALDITARDRVEKLR